MKSLSQKEIDVIREAAEKMIDEEVADDDDRVIIGLIHIWQKLTGSPWYKFGDYDSDQKVLQDSIKEHGFE